MSQETPALLRSLYYSLLHADSLEAALNCIRTTMGKEEASYVEKMVEEEQAKKQL